MKVIFNEYGRMLLTIIVASLIIGLFMYGMDGDGVGWINQSLGRIFMEKNSFYGDTIGLGMGVYCG